MNSTFTNKKTAASPTFCKQNLRPTIHIKVMNFLSEGNTKQIKVPVSSLVRVSAILNKNI